MHRSFFKYACVAALLAMVGVGCDRTPGRPPSQPSDAPQGRAALVSLGTSLQGLNLRPLPAEAGRPLAKGFGGATAWLQTSQPIDIASLRGKVVVVDFWTSCCINCLQTLPTLAALEKRFESDPIAVIGIHSPKFDAETEQERLRSAIQQYAIAHPVAIDGSMEIWNRWEVQGWPTLFVLDAHGRIVWSGSGEPDPDELFGTVGSALAEGEKEGILSRAPIPGVRRETSDTGPLAFPGKIIPLKDGGYVVSDSVHHRIVVVDATGTTQAVIGSGLAGSLDGPFAEASFHNPQGLAENGQLIYVADTENHLVRAIDRASKRVTTVAGTGELGRSPLRDATPARTTALRSPWDVLFVGDKGAGTLYIALAGSHQIAAYDVEHASIRAFAGDGRERRRDGVGTDASFAQPSGLATDGATLYVADSETSSVRAVTLATAAVRTLIGKDLFVFGDVDGIGDVVRLQHPIGIAWGAGAVWIADTYNSKLKRLDPVSLKTTTVVGGNDRKALFEPAGLFVRDGEVVVTDTHHQRIVKFALSGGAPTVMTPGGLRAPTGGVALAEANDKSSAAVVTISDVVVASGQTSRVHVMWELPKGTGINEDAPYNVRWTTSDGLAKAPDDAKGKGATIDKGFDVVVTPIAGMKSATLGGTLSLVICDIATHAVCVPVQRKLVMTLNVSGDRTETTVRVPLPAAKIQ